MISIPAVQIEQEASPKYRYRVYLGNGIGMPAFDTDRHSARQQIAGPAFVKSRTTTILLNRGDSAKVSDTAKFEIDVRRAAKSEQPVQVIRASVAGGGQ